MNLFQSLLFGTLLLFGQYALAAVNINTASAAELESLNGVGAAKAQAIIAHREKNGPFKSIDELAAVKGIGLKLVEKNRANLTTSTGKQ